MTATAPENSTAVFRNRPFLLLWLAQTATQVGGNMVIYGLTVIIFTATASSAAVSGLLLAFLVPSVLASAVAGVFVDRHDPRVILVATNLLRAAAFLAIVVANDQLVVLYAMSILVATSTTFFGPAESAMIPALVSRAQLQGAIGLFAITGNAAFALGFALLGPLVVTLAGPSALVVIVAASYLLAALLCATLPSSRPVDALPRSPREAATESREAVTSTLGQLREGIAYIAANRSISWSLGYLVITASLIGVLGVLGPAFATSALGLAPSDFVVVVLPLGIGVVIGIAGLNRFSRLVRRRRLIEGGLMALGVLLVLLAIVGPFSRVVGGIGSRVLPDQVTFLLSLLSIVTAIAFLAGVAYAVVAIPAQAQLQEDLPANVRGRVFGVLNMLVSVASFLPIIVVGPIADIVGTPPIFFAAGCLVAASGFLSATRRREFHGATSPVPPVGKNSPPIDPLSVALQASVASETAAAGAAATADPR